jgi:hypothetical protein
MYDAIIGGWLGFRVEAVVSWTPNPRLLVESAAKMERQQLQSLQWHQLSHGGRLGTWNSTSFQTRSTLGASA